MTSHADSLRAYYDSLSAWLMAGRLLRPEGGVEHYTMHRFLADPDDLAAPPGPLSLHRIVAAEAGFREDPDMLDCGCGYGGTTFDLAERLGGRWLGVTLSGVQVRRARGAARRRGLDGRVRFERRSYDDPFAERFDGVVAIESLIHSPDKAATLRNLAAALEPGGRLCVVDDMLAGPPPASAADDLAGFASGWLCPTVPTAAEWDAMLRDAGLVLAGERDLTPLHRPRPDAELARLIEHARRRRRRLPLAAMRAVQDGILGGLHLERLYNAGAMRYRLVVAEKPTDARAAG